MYFEKNSINNVKTEMHPASVYCMVAYPWFTYESKFPNDGEFFGDIIMDMCRYFPDATFTKENVFPLCNAHILPVGFLDTIMPWIIQLDSKVLTVSRSSTIWFPAHYLEHIMGIVISGLYRRFVVHWSGVIHPVSHNVMHHLKASEPLDDLTILAEKYGCDKCPSILHTYTPVYNSLFKDIRTTTKSVLEIGIGHFEMMSEIVGVNYKPGASLRMWRDYFPNANIYSCDIVEKVIFQDERIYTWVADQCKPASLENLVTNIQETGTETIDIIVDDGSHVLSHQIISFITLWKYLSPGGLYIIEDMYHPHIDLLKPICFSFQDVDDVGHYAGPENTDGFVFFRKK